MLDTLPKTVFVRLRNAFFSKVEEGKTAGDCWKWKGFKSKKGYGQVSIWFSGKAIKFQAHRLSYNFAVGKIPDNLLVLHSCDNPECCNPLHLKLGTALDNTTDMMNKGRHSNGRLSGGKGLPCA